MRIVEIFKGRWQIEAPNGTVIATDLNLGSKFVAEEYIRNYVSSFMNYNYEVTPLNKETKNV